jgi:flagellar basal-body rod protein FlgC
MDLAASMDIASSGMRAQGTRLRIVSENIANSNTVGSRPGEDPYRRKTMTFKNVLDNESGNRFVRVDRIYPDKSDFKIEYDPTHPAANKDGYVKKPNVNSLIEMADLREAQRSYEANLNVIEMSKAMIARTVELLRS